MRTFTLRYPIYRPAYAPRPDALKVAYSGNYTESLYRHLKGLGLPGLVYWITCD